MSLGTSVAPGKPSGVRWPRWPQDYRMFRRVLHILFAIALGLVALFGLLVFWVSKSGSNVKPTRPPAAVLSPAPDNEADCLAAYGSWRRVGLAGNLVCNLPTSDKGTKCAYSSECEGKCLATMATILASGTWEYVSGECSGYRTNFGCLWEVDEARWGVACYD
jgi:hypothetical protein